MDGPEDDWVVIDNVGEWKDLECFGSAESKGGLGVGDGARELLREELGGLRRKLRSGIGGADFVTPEWPKLVSSPKL